MECLFGFGQGHSLRRAFLGGGGSLYGVLVADACLFWRSRRFCSSKQGSLHAARFRLRIGIFGEFAFDVSLLDGEFDLRLHRHVYCLLKCKFLINIYFNCSNAVNRKLKRGKILRLSDVSKSTGTRKKLRGRDKSAATVKRAKLITNQKVDRQCLLLTSVSQYSIYLRKINL